jgi:pimeloyl-ACP methyl ester carboxylesterase
MLPSSTMVKDGRGMNEVELSAGTIRYRDTGDGPPIVFVHGLLVDGTLWRKVVPGLEGRFRCIVPDWPLGSHTVPMKPDADLSPPGVARLIGELLEALDLRDVTLVANDSGGALAQILVAGGAERVGRLVLTPCDSFDNFFPPLFRPMALLAKVPGGINAALRPLRIRALRRLPIAYGWTAKRRIPDEVTDAWLRPCHTSRAIRRDTARFVASVDSRYTLEAAERLHTFDRPVLIAWAPEDKFFPLEHGRRLAKLFPDARFEEVPDSYAFVPEDQPERLAELVGQFAGTTAGDAAAAR